LEKDGEKDQKKKNIFTRKKREKKRKIRRM